MDIACEQCGRPISRRAKAKIWNGERVVCTQCLHALERVVQRQQAAIALAGNAGAEWLVNDGSQQWGPYPTEQLIAFLASGRVSFQWLIWRDGMSKWVSAGLLFTIPELSNGRVELRDHGQGDGTYRFTPTGAT